MTENFGAGACMGGVESGAKDCGLKLLERSDSFDMCGLHCGALPIAVSRVVSEARMIAVVFPGDARWWFTVT